MPNPNLNVTYDNTYVIYHWIRICKTNCHWRRNTAQTEHRECWWILMPYCVHTNTGFQTVNQVQFSSNNTVVWYVWVSAPGCSTKRKYEMYMTCITKPLWVQVTAQLTVDERVIGCVCVQKVKDSSNCVYVKWWSYFCYYPQIPWKH